MQARRFCWGPKRTGRFNFQWNIISHASVVLVAASEGREHPENGLMIYASDSPRRFVGDARFTVDSIAPHDGGVTFHVTIDWPRPLTLWTDIVVFDELEPEVEGVHHV